MTNSMTDLMRVEMRSGTPSEYLVRFGKTGKKITSIIVYRESHNGILPGREFKIGDMAEYDSYNLSYYAAIESITEKTVTIAKHYDSKKHRLDLYKFCWRNHNFDLDKVREENRITSYSI